MTNRELRLPLKPVVILALRVASALRDSETSSCRSVAGLTELVLLILVVH